MVLGSLEVGSSWFVVPFNFTATTSQCTDVYRNFSSLKVILNGPFDKEEVSPPELQNCTAPLACLQQHNNYSFVFNSTLCCKKNIIVRQCSNYTLSMTPTYSPNSSCVGNPGTQNTSILTLPGSLSFIFCALHCRR